MTISEQRIVTREAWGVAMCIVIDSTARGPALGGCRWKPYPSLEDAHADARALARAMTRKAALARLALGGGKAVVVGDPRERTREQLHALGELVESLQGDYITAADMGTGQEDMAVIAERTSYVSGLPRRLGGCGDPGPSTALGVLMAMQAALAQRGRSFDGARIAIQGVGSVGRVLAERLLAQGASVVACDPRSAARDLGGVDWVEPNEILSQRCDVFSPCGPPGVIDERVASELQCEIVCGGANNPLTSLEVARRLASRGVLYVPDFLANAGGLIHLAVALEGGDDVATLRHLEVIPENLAAVITQAKTDRADMATTANRLADAAVANKADSR